MISTALVAMVLAQVPAPPEGAAPDQARAPAAASAEGGYYTPAEAQALFQAAADAYSREDFARAREGFEKLVERGYGGADVLYNLGTTCLAMGDLGAAVLALERARRAGGREEDIEANLALARAKQLDRVVGGQAEEPFLERVAMSTSGSTASVVFLVLWSTAFLSLAGIRLLPAGRRAAAIAVCALAFVGSVPAGALVASHAYVRQSVQEGVVMAQSLPARELPRDGGKVAFEVHAGLKVRLLEESGKYVRIRLPNGLEGWTEKDGVASL